MHASHTIAGFCPNLTELAIENVPPWFEEDRQRQMMRNLERWQSVVQEFPYLAKVYYSQKAETLVLRNTVMEQSEQVKISITYSSRTLLTQCRTITVSSS